MHIKIDSCPYLITQTAAIKELFPVFLHPGGPASRIMLSYDHFDDVNLGMKYVSNREACSSMAIDTNLVSSAFYRSYLLIYSSI